MVDKLKVDPTLVSIILVQRFKSLVRRGLDPAEISDDQVYQIFKAHADGKLGREGIVLVIEAMIRAGCNDTGGEPVTAAGWLAARNDGDIGVESFVAQVVTEAQPLPIADGGKHRRYLMGLLMRKLLGRVDGRIVAAVLDEALGSDRKPTSKREVSA